MKINTRRKKQLFPLKLVGAKFFFTLFCIFSLVGFCSAQTHKYASFDLTGGGCTYAGSYTPGFTSTNKICYQSPGNGVYWFDDVNAVWRCNNTSGGLCINITNPLVGMNWGPGDLLDDAIPAATICNISNIVLAGGPIPSLSQWGLLIFGLLVLNLGLIFVYKKQLITSEVSIPTTYIPFNRPAFSRYFIIVLSIIGVAFIITMTLFGYELMPFDIPGSVLTAGLIAYLIQLIKHE